MRIGELSRRTGVPVPTIKYYVREGLVPAGRLTSPNQADYGEVHEQRLRLIRALLDVGGLKVAAVADVLVAVDDPGLPEHKVLGVATDLLVSRYPEEEPDVALEAARARVDELIERRGWRVGAACPGRESLAVALASLERVGHADFGGALDTYADAAESLAVADLDYAVGGGDRDERVERAIVGTALGGAMLASLRHLAHVDRSARLHGHGQAPHASADTAPRNGAGPL